MSQFQDIPQDRFELIEAYLDGRMSESEMRAFSLKLKDDESLHADTESIRLAIHAIEVEGKLAQMNAWHQDIAPKQKQSYFPKWAIAAGLAIALGVGLWFFLPGNDVNQQLFAEYAKVDPGLPVPMSAAAADAYTFHDAMVDYKVGNYDVAIEKWKALHASNPLSDTLNYFLGAAHFNQGTYVEAVEYYKSVLNATDSSAFADKARLYLVLSWLQMGDNESIQSIDIPADAAHADALNDIVVKTAP